MGHWTSFVQSNIIVEINIKYYNIINLVFLQGYHILLVISEMLLKPTFTVYSVYILAFYDY